MADTTCGSVTVEVECNGNQAVVSFNNHADDDQEVVLVIPPGGVIKDPEGEVVYENTDGGPKKANIRIPG